MSNKFIYSLLIDTCSERAIVSLNLDNLSLDFQHIALDQDLSSSLFNAIKLLLDKHALSSKNLSFIATGTGPGSYTGIRVGAACAKAIAYANNIPLIGFCSLKSFVPKEEGHFYNVLDAKSGGIYFLEGEKNKDCVTYLKKPALIPLKDIPIHIKKPAVIISPHMNTLREKVNFFSQEEDLIDGYPEPHHLAKLCFSKYEKSHFTLSDKLQLLYLRGPEPIAL